MKKTKHFQKPSVNVKFFAVGLLLLTALIVIQLWEHHRHVEIAVEQSRFQVKQLAGNISFSINKLVLNVEEGGAIIDEYIDDLRQDSGILVRIIHSAAIDDEYGIEKDERPETEFEVASLKDGKSRDWQTEDFFFQIIPMKASVECRMCHHLSPDFIFPVPVGYVLGIVEVKIPTTALKHVGSALSRHTATTIALIISTVFLFGYVIFNSMGALKLSEEKQSAVIKTVGDGIVVVGSDSVIRSTNPELSNIFGWLEEDMVGKSVEMLTPEKDRADHKAEIKRYLAEGTSHLIGRRVELEGLKMDGSVFPVELRIKESVMGEGKDRFFTAAINDITDRKKAESKLKKAYKELRDTQTASLNIMEDLERERMQLDASLKEKELLLREIHHRVKNNMQIISSLLKLQFDYIKDDQYLWVFQDCQNRIKSMALIHENLYHSNDLSRIDFHDYIENLANNLCVFFKIDTNKILLKIEVDGISLGIDTAIPCGLIINELVSNTLKHAFPNGRDGEIRISLSEIENKNEYELVVSDNGVGLPKNLDYRHTESLGLQLVIMLAEDQLQGKVKRSKRKGTEFKINFKELKYKERI